MLSFYSKETHKLLLSVLDPSKMHSIKYNTNYTPRWFKGGGFKSGHFMRAHRHECQIVDDVKYYCALWHLCCYWVKI